MSDRPKPAIVVRLNDRDKELPTGATVERLLQDLGLSGRRGIAVAVNDAVVPRSQWNARPLAHGEHVILIQATQGG